MNRLKVSSPSFQEGGMMPSKFTCDGRNVSPSISWEGVPEDAKSLALVCDDPDAPSGDFVHWVVFNIPAGTVRFEENAAVGDIAALGMTDYGIMGYKGPCPPSGIHHYHFKVYALDLMLEADNDMDKYGLLDKMEGHILAKGELVGLYKRR
jgi:Raf kinase inhibitor-like YbhB/YbcL family protein